MKQTSWEVRFIHGKVFYKNDIGVIKCSTHESKDSTRDSTLYYQKHKGEYGVPVQVVAFGTCESVVIVFSTTDALQTNRSATRTGDVYLKSIDRKLTVMPSELSWIRQSPNGAAVRAAEAKMEEGKRRSKKKTFL